MYETEDEVKQLTNQLAMSQARSRRYKKVLQYALDDLIIRANLNDEDCLNVGQGVLNAMEEVLNEPSDNFALNAIIANVLKDAAK